MSAPRVYVQTERPLLGEVLLRLAARPIMAFSTPNGVYWPTRSPEEAGIKARLIRRMRAEGMLQAGAPDLICIWDGGAGLVELKRPAHRDLFGYHPAGTPSDDQREFARRAEAIGVRHAYCRSWDALEAQLRQWGAPA